MEQTGFADIGYSDRKRKTKRDKILETEAHINRLKRSNHSDVDTTGLNTC